MRIDLYLGQVFLDNSRSYIQKLIDRGAVKVNGNLVNKNLKISNKDEIEVSIEIEKLELNPENIKLDIVYEDENIVVVNKEAGMNTHPVPGEDGKSGTLVNALLYSVDNLAGIGGVGRPGIVHRLDKDTSGLIMVAKNDKMMRYLQAIIKDRKVKKEYIAIVGGIITDKSFRIESYIGRHPTDKTRMTTKNPVNPKLALTEGDVIGYIDDNYTIVRINLLTGRTHQIRVHLSSICYPIIGDKVYGDTDINKEVYKKYSLGRQALHAYRLELELYGKKVEFIGKLKDDMKKIVGDKFSL